MECPRCRTVVPRGLGSCQGCGFALSGPGVSMPYEQAMVEGLRFAAKRMKEAEKQLAVNDRPGAKALLADAYGVVSRLSPTMETTSEFAAYYRDLGRGFAVTGDKTMAAKCLSLARVLEPEVSGENAGSATAVSAVSTDGESPDPTDRSVERRGSASPDPLKAELESLKSERAAVEELRASMDRREKTLRSREEAVASRESRAADESRRIEIAKRELDERRREVEIKEMEVAAEKRRLREGGAALPVQEVK